MSNLTKHPGYLGWTSRGVILIHADWPAYATEHGIDYSLLSLGQFPPGSELHLLDDIDQCFLFVLGAAPSRADAFAPHRLHAALWHDDVRALLEAGYVTGARVVPYNDWALRRAEELKGLLWERPDGTLEPVPASELDEEDNFPSRSKVAIDGPLVLTVLGHSALEDLLQDQRSQIAEPLLLRAVPAIAAGLYDTAVRDACVALESMMREAIRSREYGSRLVDQFFDHAMSSRALISAQVKALRTEVRTMFRFVRNDFAHNLRVITELQCYALLVRISGIYQGIQAIATPSPSDA